MRKKTVYPAQRAKRDVSYSKSYKLVQTIGEEKIRELLSKAGMYSVCKQLELMGYETSPYVVRHVRKKLRESDDKS